MTRPFEGVKILDFTQVLAGPSASYQLALLGVERARQGHGCNVGASAAERREPAPVPALKAGHDRGG